MTSSAVRTTLSPVREWPAVELLWRELEREARPSFFRSWSWIGCLAQERFPDPVLLQVERDNRTVGLALLNRVRSRFGAERVLLSESGDPTLDAVYIEHNGVLLSPDARDLLSHCLDAMLSAPIGSERARSRLGSGRQLRLSGVDAAYLAAARQVGKVRVVRESAAPFVDLRNLPPHSDSYLASLSANTRYQIRRSNRSFAQLGDLEVREAASIEEALSFLDALAALHQATWNARGFRGAFGNPSFLRFHRALVERALPRGEIVLLRISVGSKVLGYLYNFRLNETVVAYQSGFDYPAAATLNGSHAKPGLTCHYAAVLRALNEGAYVYDFLAGPDRYKRSLTRTAQPLFWLDITAQKPLTRLTLQLSADKESQRQKAANVLVLGDDTRAFLAIVRSLGRRGINVHAAPANFRSPALTSRYIRRIHDLPPWTGSGAEWSNAIRRLLSGIQFALVIPCNETTLLPLQRHRADLESLTRLAIPDDHAISVLFDKHATRQLCQRLGVPIAAGRLLRSNDTAQTLMAELGFPVVLKPRQSYSLEALASRGKVQVVGDPTQLDALVSQCVADATVAEQFFPGQGVGISLLASRGRVLQAFEHHRVHETAGASFYRISAALTEDKLAACEAIVTALAYTGLAMFEFKHNPSGQWILLEVNARPWGSMPLPQALGVDFPYRWFRLLTANEEIPAVSYATGVYGRNLVPDLLALKTEATARELGRIAIARFVCQRALELLRPIAGREVHDVLVGDDLRPGFVELASVATGMRDRISRLAPSTAARQRRRARQQVTKALREARGELLILFVCAGNICRSPFAEALLRSRLNDRSIHVSSAGMMPQVGRSTPNLGLQAATAYGVDLSGHRSVWLTPETADTPSLIFVFDETNRTALFDRYPKVRAQVVSLGDLNGAGTIRDPIDGDLNEFERVYGSIADAIAVLVPLLDRPGAASAIPQHSRVALSR